MSLIGKKLPIWNVRSSVAKRGRADWRGQPNSVEIDPTGTSQSIRPGCSALAEEVACARVMKGDVVKRGVQYIDVSSPANIDRMVAPACSLLIASERMGSVGTNSMPGRSLELLRPVFGGNYEGIGRLIGCAG